MKIFRTVLDILMLADFIILQNTDFTGGFIHEISGLILALLFVVHICVNMKMTSKMLGNFKSLKFRSKLSLVADILLFTAMIVCVTSGLLVSSIIGITSMPVIVSQIHIWSGISAFIIMIVHLGLHISPLLAKINKVYDNKILPLTAETITFCCFAVLLSIYSLRDYVFANQEKMPVADNPHTDSRTLDSLPYPKDDSSVSDESSETDRNKLPQITEKDTESSKTEQISPESQAEPAETLEEYLSKMHCTGCGRHCPLSAPQCGRGRSQQQQATQEYNQQYNTDETY